MILTSGASQNSSYRIRHAKSLATALAKVLRLGGIKTPKLLNRLLHHYTEIFSSLDEVDIMGAIKCSLATFVSKRTRQSELPEKKKGAFKLFPSGIYRIVKKFTNINTSRKDNLKKALRLIWSIAQTKRVCADVSDENVKNSLNSFIELVTSGGTCDESTCDGLYKLGEKVGEIVNSIYDPTIFSYPGKSATMEISRKKGGTKEDLKRFVNKNFREEPFVVCISGKPGIGKTTLNKSIVYHLSKRLGYPEDCVYTRTCNTDHWDGYKGQPIVIIDDFGQNTNQSDVIEFITLVSSNKYIVPMADLKDKGREFTSQFIILNTNQTPSYNTLKWNRDCSVFSAEALYRRFHCCINIRERKGDLFTYSHSVNGQEWIEYDSPTNCCKGTETILPKGKICEKIFSQYLNFGGKWMLEGGVSDTYSEFGLLYNKQRRSHWFKVDHYAPRYDVEPVGLKEPLKVRVITKGPTEHAVLGNFQKALWKSLQILDPEVFSLTYGKDLSSLDLDLEKGEVYLSGDYTSSTDCIYQNATESLMEGILSKISHSPTKSYARSGLKAFIHYNGKVFITNRGQMMGWRLSFPLLCLINYYVSKDCGFRKFYINGDDFLGLGSHSAVSKWNSNIKTVGFERSIGKNYVSDKFGTINSQLVVMGQWVPYYNLLLLKRSDTYNVFSNSLKYYNHNVIIKENGDWLKNSPRSLYVSQSKGGIGIKTTIEDGTHKPEHEKRARKVYVVDFLRSQNRIHKTPRGNFYSNVLGKEMPLDTYENFLDDNEPSKMKELTNKEFNKLWKKFRNYSGVRDFVQKGKLCLVPNLTLGYLPKKVHISIKDWVSRNSSGAKRFTFRENYEDPVRRMLKINPMIRIDA